MEKHPNLKVSFGIGPGTHTLRTAHTRFF
eukprot:COSAG06_NODE_50598_length_317_cov_1.417431_1_plen_28_part_10